MPVIAALADQFRAIMGATLPACPRRRPETRLSRRGPGSCIDITVEAKAPFRLTSSTMAATTTHVPLMRGTLLLLKALG